MMVSFNVISPSVVGCYQFFEIGITFMFHPEGEGSMSLQGADTRLHVKKRPRQPQIWYRLSNVRLQRTAEVNVAKKK